VLARYLLDCPVVVSGRSVLDFAAGSGFVGIGAAMAEAARVVAVDAHAFSGAAMALNARLNGVHIKLRAADFLGPKSSGWGVVLAGNVCYERPMVRRVVPWLLFLVADRALVLPGDRGRTYLPKRGLTQLARFAADTNREIEGTDARDTRVWRVEPEGWAGAPSIFDCAAVRPFEASRIRA
jgi:predicted nicotinamide N-methyase